MSDARRTRADGTAMIELRHVHKWFGEFHVLKDVSLSVGRGERVVICGHTHRPFDRMIRDVRVVNAGSVGMPFGDRGAHWLLLGETIEPRRTSYDLSEAARRVRETAYPRKDEFIQIAL